MAAAAAGNTPVEPSIVKLLLDAKADPQLRNAFGLTPLPVDRVGLASQYHASVPAHLTAR